MGEAEGTGEAGAREADRTGQDAGRLPESNARLGEPQRPFEEPPLRLPGQVLPTPERRPERLRATAIRAPAPAHPRAAQPTTRSAVPVKAT